VLVIGGGLVGLVASGALAQAGVRRDDGRVEEVVARYVIASDGAGSPTRRRLGVKMEGPGPLGRFFMVHFEADLTPWIRERPGPSFWIHNPASPGCLKIQSLTQVPEPGTGLLVGLGLAGVALRRRIERLARAR